MNSKSVISEKRLWRDEPTLEELINYLKLPIAVDLIFNKLKEVPRKMLRINIDDPYLAFKGYVLEGNRYEFPSLDKSKENSTVSKIGRNKPCPCGSGKNISDAMGKLYDNAKYTKKLIR